VFLPIRRQKTKGGEKEKRVFDTRGSKTPRKEGGRGEVELPPIPKKGCLRGVEEGGGGKGKEGTKRRPTRKRGGSRKTVKKGKKKKKEKFGQNRGEGGGGTLLGGKEGE